MALTLRKIANCKKPGRYRDERGLYLQVARGGTQSWVFRFERDGREQMMGLGPVHTIGLAEARERARLARLALLDGINPLDARNRQRAATDAATASLVTFETAARAWHAAKEGGYRNATHATQVLSTLETFAFPAFGSLSVAAIETPHVLAALEAIWSRIPTTASRLRGRIENVLNYAAAAGYRSCERPNPARWKGHLDHLLAAPKKLAKNAHGERHFASLPHPELPGFYAELSTRPGVAARALQFTILTAARTGETIGAKRSEIDFGQELWTIPAARMKIGKAHEVPLSDAAIELLKALPVEAGNPYLFIGPRRNGLSSMAMLAVLKRMGRSDITAHGFRSTFRTWAGDTTNFPRDICEAALAHTVGSEVEKAYMRSSMLAKRGKLMEAWARFCTTAQPASNVVSLKTKATG